MRPWRQQAAQGRVGPGTTVRFERTFTAADVAAFGQLTRDDNPVHSDERWCEQKGFERPVCHGLLVGSMVCEVGGEWGWLATGLAFRFRRPAYIGETLVAEVTVVEVDERWSARAECVIRNGRGETVATAELRGFLPGPAEQDLLGEMLDPGDADAPPADRRDQ